MRAIVVDQPGGIDVMVLRDVDDPEPGPRDVLIETAFCGCNWADLQRRAGTYPHPVEYPHIIGREVSGSVAAVGAEVEGFAVGYRVIGRAWHYLRILERMRADRPPATGPCAPVQPALENRIRNREYRYERTI